MTKQDDALEIAMAFIGYIEGSEVYSTLAVETKVRINAILHPPRYVVTPAVDEKTEHWGLKFIVVDGEGLGPAVHCYNKAQADRIASLLND